MRLFGRLSQRSRGVGSIIGAVFLALILLSGFAFYAIDQNVTQHYNNTVSSMNNNDRNRNQENIVIKQIAITSNSTLNVTAENDGPTQSQLIWLGIFNETATPENQTYQKLNNIFVGPGQTANIVSNVTVTTGNQYLIQLVTELGNTVDCNFYSANFVNCALTLVTAPPTVYQGNNVTVLLTLTANDTSVDSIQNLTATINWTPTGLVQLVSNSPLSVTSLTQGTSAFFWWVYNAVGTGTVSFNASYLQAPAGTYALSTAQIVSPPQQGGQGSVTINGVNCTASQNPLQWNLLGSTQNISGSISSLASNDTNYASFSSYYNATNINHFVDNNSSNVDNVTNWGTQSNFTAQQAGPDNVKDTLTEANSTAGTPWGQTNTWVQNNGTNVDGTSTIGSWSNFTAQETTDNINDTLKEGITNGGTATMGTTTNTGTSYTTIAANGFAGQEFAAPAGTIDITNVTFYGRATTYGTTVGVKIIITDTSGNILTNGISNVVACSSTASSYTATYANLPLITAGVTYGLEAIVNASFRLYYVASTGGTSQTGTNTYSSPTSPLSFTGGTVNYRTYYATVDIANYRLNLQENWTSAVYNADQAQLCIHTGPLDTESLLVSYWTGSAWTQISSGLSANAWNNLTITSYLSSASFTIRFSDGMQTNDTSQSTWQIESMLISSWNTTNYQLNIEEQWTSVDNTTTNQQLCIFTGTWTSTEALEVDGWNTTSSTWVVLNSSLLSNAWNNITLPAGLLTATFTIRFIDGTRIGDTVQNTWSIDATLLHLWSNQYKAQVEFTGFADLQNWTQIIWFADSSWNTSPVNVTVQLYNYALGNYSSSGDGYAYYVSNSTNTDYCVNQTITANPTNFRNLTGYWKVEITGVASTQFQMNVNWIELRDSYAYVNDSIPYSALVWYTIQATAAAGNPIPFTYASLYANVTAVTFQNATGTILPNPAWLQLDANGTFQLQVTSTNNSGQTFVLYVAVGTVLQQKTITQVAKQ